MKAHTMLPGIELTYSKQRTDFIKTMLTVFRWKRRENKSNTAVLKWLRKIIYAFQTTFCFHNMPVLRTDVENTDLNVFCLFSNQRIIKSYAYLCYKHDFFGNKPKGNYHTLPFIATNKFFFFFPVVIVRHKQLLAMNGNSSVELKIWQSSLQQCYENTVKT